MKKVFARWWLALGCYLSMCINSLAINSLDYGLCEDALVCTCDLVKMEHLINADRYVWNNNKTQLLKLTGRETDKPDRIFESKLTELLQTTNLRMIETENWSLQKLCNSKIETSLLKFFSFFPSSSQVVLKMAWVGTEVDSNRESVADIDFIKCKKSIRMFTITCNAMKIRNLQIHFRDEYENIKLIKNANFDSNLIETLNRSNSNFFVYAKRLIRVSLRNNPLRAIESDVFWWQQNLRWITIGTTQVEMPLQINYTEIMFFNPNLIGITDGDRHIINQCDSVEVFDSFGNRKSEPIIERTSLMPKCEFSSLCVLENITANHVRLSYMNKINEIRIETENRFGSDSLLIDATVNWIEFNGMYAIYDCSSYGYDIFRKSDWFWNEAIYVKSENFDATAKPDSNFDQCMQRHIFTKAYPNVIDCGNWEIRKVLSTYLFYMLNARSLNLSFNLIDSFNKHTFEKMLNLVELDVSHNPIKYLEKVAFQNINQLRVLHLFGIEFNNIQCIFTWSMYLQKINFANSSTTYNECVRSVPTNLSCPIAISSITFPPSHQKERAITADARSSQIIDHKIQNVGTKFEYLVSGGSVEETVIKKHMTSKNDYITKILVSIIKIVLKILFVMGILCLPLVLFHMILKRCLKCYLK